jgi:hypothetical protein
VIHDSENNVAGAVEIKGTGDTKMDVLGGGFAIAELVALTSRVAGQTVVLGSAQANGHGAFLATVNTPSGMVAGYPYTIEAVGNAGNVGVGVVIVTNKNASD